VEGASCPNGHNVQEGFVFCPACGATIACPNGHPVREGAKFCPQCGNAYATPNVSKATEMVTLAAKVGGEASDLLASPVSKPTGGVDIADVMAGESKTTKCPKCLVVFSRDLFESHRDTCRHRLVTCPKCNNLFGSETLERHLQNCGTRIVSGTPPKSSTKKHTIRNGLVLVGALVLVVGIIVVATSGGGASGPTESLLETNLLIQVQCTTASFCFDYPNVSYVDCSSAGDPYDPGGSYSTSWKPGAQITCQGYDGNGFLIGDIGITAEQGVSASNAQVLMADPPSYALAQYRYTDYWVYEYNGYNQYCHCVEPDGDGG